MSFSETLYTLRGSKYLGNTEDAIKQPHVGRCLARHSPCQRQTKRPSGRRKACSFLNMPHLWGTITRAVAIPGPGGRQVRVYVVIGALTNRASYILRWCLSSEGPPHSFGLTQKDVVRGAGAGLLICRCYFFFLNFTLCPGDRGLRSKQEMMSTPRHYL